MAAAGEGRLACAVALGAVAAVVGIIYYLLGRCSRYRKFTDVGNEED